jgi:integrase
VPVSAGISTDAQCRALKALDRTYDVRVQKSPGLYLRVHPSGKRTWVFRYRSESGNQRRMPLGSYPGIQLSVARTKALKLKASVSDGNDPFEERAERRQQLRHGDTLAELAESYFQASMNGTHGGRRRPRRQGGIDIDRQRFRTHIAPGLGNRPFKVLTRADIRSFMDKLANGHLAPATVAGIGGLVRSILSYAVHRDLVDANVAMGLTTPVAPQPRDRRFSEKSLGVLWPALAASSTLIPWSHNDLLDSKVPARAPIEPVTACGLMLLALTLLRRSELAGGRWEEIDFKDRLWRIPAARMKANREHTVPLSRPAMALLKRLQTMGVSADSPYVLPASNTPERHIDPRALTRGLARTLALYKLGKGSPHDLRRTAATWLTSHGVRRFTVSWLLAHSAQDGAAITAIYDRNDYLDERAAALKLWGDYLESLGAIRTANAGPKATVEIAR